MDEIYERLKTIFRDVFDDDELVLTPALTASDVAEWDSLAHVRLMVAVGKAFGIKIPAAQTATLQNVGQLAELIRTKTSGR
jgi:acyl carrier protein